MIGIAGHVRSNNCQAVGESRKFGKRGTESDAGERGANLAGGTAGLDRRIHMRVEGLDLARPAVKEEKDDAAIGCRTRFRGQCATRSAKCEAAERHRPNAEKVAAAESTRIVKRQHGKGPGIVADRSTTGAPIAERSATIGIIRQEIDDTTPRSHNQRCDPNFRLRPTARSHRRGL